MAKFIYFTSAEKRQANEVDLPRFLLVHKENHRLCRWKKIANGEGKSRQEKVSGLE